jgi:hypothetical protein
MIIALTGKAQNGKDTVADVMLKVLDKSWQRKSFAEPMKKMLECMVKHWTPEFIEAHKDEVDPTVGLSPRQVLNSIGPWSRETLPSQFPLFAQTIGDRVWARRLLADYSEDKNWIITDLRFLAEEAEFGLIGVRPLVLRPVRPGYPLEVNPMDAWVDDLHVDIILPNDKGLTAYYDLVGNLATELQNYEADIKASGYGNFLRHWHEVSRL